MKNIITAVIFLIAICSQAHAQGDLHVTSSSQYTVPSGKNLHIVDVHLNNSGTTILMINGLNFKYEAINIAGYNAELSLIAGPTDIISTTNTGSASVVFNGYLK